MAIRLEQSKTGTSTLASTVVAFTNNVVLGNLIAVAVATNINDDVSGITDTLGNNYVKAFAANGTGIEGELWYAKNILGGANTVTVAYTTAPTAAVVVQEYSGIDTVTVLDQTKTGSGNNSSPDSGSTPRINQNLELLIGVVGGVSGTFTAGGSFVNLTQVANTTINCGIEDLSVTSTGTYNATFGASGSIQWACGVASFRASPQGTTTSTSSTSASTFSTSSTSVSTSSTSTSISSTSRSTSTSSTSYSMSITTMSTSSTSSSISSTSLSSTSSSVSTSSTSSSISSTSQSSTSLSSTSSSSSRSSTSSSLSSTSASTSSTSYSTSSTSFSSTSSSSSTSTTAIPIDLIFSYQDQAPYTKIEQFIKTGSWVCPVGVTAVLAECWAGGGGGGGATTDAGGGGGGGQYARLNALTVTAGTSYTVTVGVGGTGGASMTAGGDTSFSSAATVLAKGGTAGAKTASGVAAGGVGSTAGAVGDVTFLGGNGGTGSTVNQAGGGGGSGAGSFCIGHNGGDSAGGGTAGAASTPAAIYGGQGGAGAGGSAAVIGRSLGGGGGGANANGNAGVNGAGGMVQLTYTVTQVPPSTGASLTNIMTAALVTDIDDDDGDYFIEYGSDFMIREYKRDWINNTDSPGLVWRGRTTVDTRTSPVLFQIYNQNSAAWETLAVVNKVPADTDFAITISQTSNVSNYYDASNIVTFRSYQQVV